MAKRSTPLFDTLDLPGGFVYREDVLAPDEERDLLTWASGLEFGTVVMHGVASRRGVVQFGWRYDFDRSGLRETHEMPDELLPLRERAARLTRATAPAFTEALVTQYPPGAGIGWHRDAPPFDIIVGVSLGAACRMRFRRGRTGAWETREVVLEPRSAYVLDGEARRVWQHGIPPVAETRYSITFRTLRERPAAARQ